MPRPCLIENPKDRRSSYDLAMILGEISLGTYNRSFNGTPAIDETMIVHQDEKTTGNIGVCISKI